MIHFLSFRGRALSIMVVFLAFTAALCFAQDAPGATTPSDNARPGALVDKVNANGPAAKAGIAVHDVITAVEGTTVQSLVQIAQALARHKPGDSMEFTISRASDGTVANVTMILGASPDDASRAYMGLTLVGYMLLLVPPEQQATPAPAQTLPGI